MARFTVSNEALTDAVSRATIPLSTVLAITSTTVYACTSRGENDITALTRYQVTDSESLLNDLPKYALRELPPHLSPASARVTVINSVTAGRHTGERVYDELVGPLLTALGVTHEYIATTSASDISTFATSLGVDSSNDQRPHTVILLSGDTSIHELVNSLHCPNAPRTLTVAPIPTGSGNALMTSLSIATPFAALFVLLHGTATLLNPFYASFPKGSLEVIPPTEVEPEGKTIKLVTPDADGGDGQSKIYALVVASWAIHAALVGDSDSPEYRKLGNERFKVAARENLARNASWHGMIRYTTATSSTVTAVEGPHSYVLLTSISSLEPGFKIAPTATPLSGKVEFIHMRALKGDDIMRLLMLAYQDGAHVREPEVLYTEVESLSVEVHERELRMRRWCVDGRIFIVPEDATVSVHRGVANVRGWEVFILV
ncbi:ATP-NAD kinase-like domain-containing protein [Limtongia smithiae]|uniref:ATP-NAD kinase-like domain-containing protein n=1 Tax=Limtongia smithiae TaxID=1125753 RepID=UPI0034CF6096